MKELKDMCIITAPFIYFFGMLAGFINPVFFLGPGILIVMGLILMAKKVHTYGWSWLLPNPRE